MEERLIPQQPSRDVALKHAPRRIVVRGVNWLGDAVMTTPAVARLRERFPEARITLLTQPKIAGIWERHPAIDEAIAFPPGTGVWTVGGRLREKGFDLAVVLPNSPRSALEALLARIPRRVGYARPWRNWMLTLPVPERPGFVAMRQRTTAEVKWRIAHPPPKPPVIPSAAHQVHHYLHLVGALGAQAVPTPPQIAVGNDEVAAVRVRFKWPATGAASKPLFGLNAGAEYGPAKRWPVERFIEAAIRIHARTRCHWWILGGRGDRERAEQISSGIRGGCPPTSIVVTSLAGATTLRELCAALKACDAVLTNDTGPMHLAAAVGTRVVALFGSTSPELTGPGLPGDARHRILRGRAPCAPCFRRDCPVGYRCMTDLSTDQVVEAVIAASMVPPHQ